MRIIAGKARGRALALPRGCAIRPTADRVKEALFSLVGLLGLSGITVNGAIVMIDRMNERLANGEPIDQAARGAAVDRVRALLLTTFTTIGGMAPLLFEESLQAQFLIPIAITLSWGLGFSTMLLLFLLPALVGIGVDFRRGTSWLWQLLMPRPAPGT